MTTTPPEMLTDAQVLHLWDEYAGNPSPGYPLDNNDKLQFARAVERALLARLSEQQPVVTDSMVDAYLAANTAYWQEVDAKPFDMTKPWRQGTPKEATRVSLQAALYAAPVPTPTAQAVPADILAMDRRDADRWRALEAAVDSSGVTVAIPDSGGDQWDGHAISDMGDLQEWADKQIAAAPTPTGAGDDQGGA